jgi:hypothetical protein
MSVGKKWMLDGLVSTHCDFTHTFYKLDHFIHTRNICCIAMKKSSFERVDKFTPKKFYKINLRLLSLSSRPPFDHGPNF